MTGLKRKIQKSRDKGDPSEKTGISIFLLSHDGQREISSVSLDNILLCGEEKQTSFIRKPRLGHSGHIRRSRDWAKKSDEEKNSISRHGGPRNAVRAQNFFCDNVWKSAPPKKRTLLA